MKPYNPEAKCPKCGSLDLQPTWHKKDRVVDFYNEYDDDKEGKFLWFKYKIQDYVGTRKPICCQFGREEHVDRKCKSCDYIWPELPLDTKIEEKKYDET